MKIPHTKWLSILALSVIVLYFLGRVFAPDLVTFNKEKTNERLSGHYRIFLSLFQKLGYDFRFWYSDSPIPDQAVLVIFDYNEEKNGLEKVISWVEKGNTLFLFGAKETTYVEDIYFRIGTPDTHFSVMPPLKSSAQSIAFDTHVFLKIFSRETVPLLKGTHGEILSQVRYKKGMVYILSDSRLLKNEMMRKKRVAIIVNDLIRPFHDKRFYIRLKSGIDRRKQLTLFHDRKIRLFTVHFLLLILIFILYRGIRIGKPMVYEPHGRRKIKEHLEGIGHLFEKYRSYKSVYDINQEYFIFCLGKMMPGSGKPTVDQMKAYLFAQLKEKKISRITDEDIDRLFEETQYMSRKTMMSSSLTMGAILRDLKKEALSQTEI